MTITNKQSSNQKKNKDYFAEVIESSIEHFIAQCWRWDDFPTFGSLVEVNAYNHTVFACVTSITTTSIDPSRKPFAYQKTEDELRAEQPQIFEFLKTTFTAHIIGYQPKTSHASLCYQLAAQPCKIHAFVKKSSIETQQYFFRNSNFLAMLFPLQHTIINFDELLLAIVTKLINDGLWDKTLIKEFYQQFCLLTGNDYRRLKLFFQRVARSDITLFKN